LKRNQGNKEIQTAFTGGRAHLYKTGLKQQRVGGRGGREWNVNCVLTTRLLVNLIGGLAKVDGGR